MNDQIAIVEILLRNGANIEAECENFSETPICYAIQYGFTEMVKVLLRYGARIDQPNRRRKCYLLQQQGNFGNTFENKAESQSLNL